MAKKRTAKRRATTDIAVENDENLDESQANSVENGDAGSSKSTSGKKKKSETTKANQEKETPKNKAKTNVEKADTEDYEVEKILDVNYKKNGKREFLIRWKNYSVEHDTWEPEDNLSCHELITKFLEVQKQTDIAVENDENLDESQANSVENGDAGSSKSTSGKKKKSKTTKANQEKETPKNKAKTNVEKADTEDYEVEKILDVNYKKNGKREFLIRWKNYSAKHDTWEPEDNLSCDELITKFLDLQEQREKQPRKDLRERPKLVTRYAAPTCRKSKRTGIRKSYNEQEDEDDD